MSATLWCSVSRKHWPARAPLVAATTFSQARTTNDRLLKEVVPSAEGAGQIDDAEPARLSDLLLLASALDVVVDRYSEPPELGYLWHPIHVRVTARDAARRSRRCGERLREGRATLRGSR
jgi:hypothetical protein